MSVLSFRAQQESILKREIPVARMRSRDDRTSRRVTCTSRSLLDELVRYVSSELDLLRFTSVEGRIT